MDFGFCRRKDEYDTLLRELDVNHPDWIVISSNYDILLEQALERMKIPFHYPFVPFGDSNREGLAVYKPHGSINFFAQHDAQVSYEKPDPGAEPGKPMSVYDNTRGEVCLQYPIVDATMGIQNVVVNAMCGSPHPILANFMDGKESDNNQPTLHEIRKEVLQRIACVEELVLIGFVPFET